MSVLSEWEWQAVGEPSAETKAKELELIRLVSDDESYKAARRETYERNKGKMKPILGNERLFIDEIIEDCNKEVAELERFNKFEILGGSEISRHLTREYWGHRQVAEYLEELKQYRDLEEQGLLLRLPVAVGGTVWVSDRDGKPREMILDEPDIRCHCAKEDNLCMALCDRKNTGVCAYRFKNDGSDIGERAFLTQSEAEEKLRELEGK